MVGLHIGQETVDVEMQQGTRFWTSSYPVAAGSLRDTVSLALREIPTLRWFPHPAVDIIVGSHASKVKRLRGLPALANAKALDAIVRENATRFFLCRVPFVSTNVYRLDESEALGGILDAAVVDAIVAGCMDAGFFIRTIVPEEDIRLGFKPFRARDLEVLVPKARAMWAGIAMATSVLIALFLPAIIALWSAHLSKGELAKFAGAERRAESITRDTQRSTLLLGSITRFEQHRSSVTALLAALADALPSESAITTIRSDSAGVDLVVVSARAAGVLGALDHVPGVLSPAIVGPISKEMAGTRELERATIHFKYDMSAVSLPRVRYAVDRKDVDEDNQ